MIKEIVKVWAEWCGPCKTLAPIFERVSKMDEFKDITFREVNAEDDDDFAEKYSVRNLPTILFLDENGEVVKRSVGLMRENELIDLIKTIIS